MHYADEKGFSYKTVYKNTVNELKQAVLDKQIDAMVIDSLYTVSDLKMVAKAGRVIHIFI